MKKKDEAGSIFYQRVQLAKGRCEYCGAAGREIHHVFGGHGRRSQSESLETIVYLCSECHRGKKSPEVIKYFKVKVCGELFRKYGEYAARKRCGGRLYYNEP